MRQLNTIDSSRVNGGVAEMVVLGTAFAGGGIGFLWGMTAVPPTAMMAYLGVPFQYGAYGAMAGIMVGGVIVTALSLFA